MNSRQLLDVIGFGPARSSVNSIECSRREARLPAFALLILAAGLVASELAAATQAGRGLEADKNFRAPGNRLNFAGFEHCPLGAASLSISSNQLVVGDLGADGQDGVFVNLGRAKGWQAALEDLDAAALPTGAYVEALTKGMFNGTNEHPIVRTRLEDVGSQWQVHFDFSYMLTTPCCPSKGWFQHTTYANNTPPAREGHAMTLREVTQFQ